MRDERLSFRKGVHVFLKALKLSLKQKTVASIIVTILGFPMAFLPMLVAIVLRRFADEVQNLYGSGSAMIASVLGTFILFSVLYILQLIWSAVRNYFSKKDAINIASFMKERILRCICNVKYKYIENHDDFRQRIRFIDTDAGDLVAESMQNTVSWLQNVLTFVSVVYVLSGVDIWIVVIMVLTCIPAIVLAYIFKDEEYIEKTKWNYESLMAISYYFEATWPTSINDVRFFGLYQWLKNKFRAMMKRYLAHKNKITAKHTLWNAVADLFRNGVYVAVLLITALRIFEDPQVGIGAFLLVFTMAGQLQDVGTKIFVAAAQFISDVRYMQDFFYLDELEYEVRDPRSVSRKSFGIEFDNVCFTYPNTEREVIHNLSVQIAEGEKVAIVGENGSGKSTFISLLTAMYNPDSGKVKIGGEDVFSDLSSSRKTLSAIFQEFAHYETTLRENVTVSDSTLNASDDEIMNIAESVGASDVIEQQADGLDEIVGSFSPTGNNLSGGQWQKIAIVRGLYRSNAKIMVLDEPTAALDPIAEAEIYRNFAVLTEGKTTILVSHRLGITQLVDRILVFDRGQIVEDGDHATLMNQDGLYAEMYRAQAKWYE